MIAGSNPAGPTIFLVLMLSLHKTYRPLGALGLKLPVKNKLLIRIFHLRSYPRFLVWQIYSLSFSYTSLDYRLQDRELIHDGPVANSKGVRKMAEYGADMREIMITWDPKWGMKQCPSI